jgi:hypothetical protein
MEVERQSAPLREGREFCLEVQNVARYVSR